MFNENYFIKSSNLLTNDHPEKCVNCDLSLLICKSE